MICGLQKIINFMIRQVIYANEYFPSKCVSIGYINMNTKNQFVPFRNIYDILFRVVQLSPVVDSICNEL